MKHHILYGAGLALICTVLCLPLASCKDNAVDAVKAQTDGIGSGTEETVTTAQPDPATAETVIALALLPTTESFPAMDYTVQPYEDVLGTDGVIVEYVCGAQYKCRDYYAQGEDGYTFLVSAVNATEAVDLDGDGERELFWRMGMGGELCICDRIAGVYVSSNLTQAAADFLGIDLFSLRLEISETNLIAEINLPDGETESRVFDYRADGTLTTDSGGAIQPSEPSAFCIKEDVIYSADGKTLYKYCSDITSFVLPADVLYIAPNAFEGSPISDITFNDTLQFIGSWAFHDTALQAIDLPDSVKQIDYGAFHGCRNAVTGSIPETCNVLYGFRLPHDVSDVFVAPFYTEQYDETAFPREAIINCDNFFQCVPRNLSTDSPGSGETELPDREARYHASSPLEELYHHVDFKLLSRTEAVMIFTGWWNKVTVYSTDDGGMTWNETETRPTPTYGTNPYVGSIWTGAEAGLLYYYKTHSRAYTYMSDEELVQYTVDGGKTWHLLTRGDLASDVYPIGYFDRDFDAVGFEKKEDAYIITFGLYGKVINSWILGLDGSTLRENGT